MITAPPQPFAPLLQSEIGGVRAEASDGGNRFAEMLAAASVTSSPITNPAPSQSSARESLSGPGIGEAAATLAQLSTSKLVAARGSTIVDGQDPNPAAAAAKLASFPAQSAASEPGSAKAQMANLGLKDTVESLAALSLQTTTLEVNPAPASLPDQSAIDRALTDPAPVPNKSAAPDLRPTARVFDEDGFFDPMAIGKADPGPARSAAPSGIPVAGISGDVTSTLAMPELVPSSSFAAEQAVPDLPSVASIGARAAPALESSRSASSYAAISAIVAPAEADAPGDGIEALPATRANLREVKAQTNPVQVALHELAQGVRVSVRLDALGQSERQQLHDEIVSLLAQHGLVSDEVRIAAPAARARSQGRR